MEDKRLAKNLQARIMLETLIHNIGSHASGKGKQISEEADQYIKQNKDANAAEFEAYGQQLKAKCPWF